MHRPLTILGLESSCDETAAGVVRLSDAGAHVLANVVFSQMADHAPYGGVVPEIAARAHVSAMDHVIKAAMTEAGLGFQDLDGVAATAGPGLIGGVMVGLMAGKAIALASGLPLIAVNHLEGHALSPRLVTDCAFPYLLLLVSGGHCQTLWVEDVGKMTRIGTTIDDAVGEAFDKTAKTLGLGYPGGPRVEAMAQDGDGGRFEFPVSLSRDAARHFDFSFAGLKTAVLRQAEALATDSADGVLARQDCADICASFQAAVANALTLKAQRALEHVIEAHDLDPANRRVVVAGGVAANQHIRTQLADMVARLGGVLHAPPLAYCGDNGAMIALVGAEKLARGQSDGLDVRARPRWPLDSWAAAHAPVHIAGQKGAKS